MKYFNYSRKINYRSSLSIFFGMTLTGFYIYETSTSKSRLKLNEHTNLIYSWGNGIAGQLGVGEEMTSQPIPKQIKDIPGNILKIHAAFDVSCAVTKKGEIFVWGKTKDGALGVFPGGSLNIDSPSLFVHSEYLDSLPIDIDFSKEHGLLVTEKGTLYSWGIDMYNKLGHSAELNPKSNQRLRNVPTKSTYELVKFGKVELPANKRVKSAKCGYNHSLCLDTDGVVYSWGYAKDAALGHSDFENISLPKQITYFTEKNIKISQIDSGDFFCMALSEEGDVYTWGLNNYGQLGLGRISQQLKVNKPTQVNVGNKVTGIFAGEDHCACVTEDGQGFIWGYGLDGRLGNKNKMNQNVPVKVTIDNSKITKIACGGHHTAILTEDGNLYMCGNGRDGELGRGDLLESQSVIRDEPLIVFRLLIALGFFSI